jgi:hypothetical protein
MIEHVFVQNKFLWTHLVAHDAHEKVLLHHHFLSTCKYEVKIFKTCEIFDLELRVAQQIAKEKNWKIIFKIISWALCFPIPTFTWDLLLGAPCVELSSLERCSHVKPPPPLPPLHPHPSRCRSSTIKKVCWWLVFAIVRTFPMIPI